MTAVTVEIVVKVDSCESSNSRGSGDSSFFSDNRDSSDSRHSRGSNDSRDSSESRQSSDSRARSDIRDSDLASESISKCENILESAIDVEEVEFEKNRASGADNVPPEHLIVASLLGEPECSSTLEGSRKTQF